MTPETPAVDSFVKLVEAARTAIGQVIVGQSALVDQLLAGVLAGGHVLLEGPPGTAKTLLVRVIARLFDVPYKRVQFTPDLMPSDIMGTSVFDPRDQSFRFRPGPIFTAFLLGDEINRAPPKTQSALLEAMQERQVTADGTTHQLPETFTVFATQNPIEQEGTYPLPEAQLDRFLMKLKVGYPDEKSEVDILKVHQQGGRGDDLARFQLPQIGGEAVLKSARDSIRNRVVRDEILGYIAKLIRSTRDDLRVEVGASPRAGLMLLTAAKGRAALEGRGHVLPDDVKNVALPVLRHRLILKAGAEVDGCTTDEVIESVLSRQEVPR